MARETQAYLTPILNRHERHGGACNPDKGEGQRGEAYPRGGVPVRRGGEAES
jgi:hypothetical protein